MTRHQDRKKGRVLLMKSAAAGSIIFAVLACLGTRAPAQEDISLPGPSLSNQTPDRHSGLEKGASNPHAVDSPPDQPPDHHVLAVGEAYCRIESDVGINAIEELLFHLSRHAKPFTDDLPGMLARGTIRVLTTTSATNFSVSRGRFYGFEYSMLKEYEKHLNHGRGGKEPRIVLEFIPVPEVLLHGCLEKGIGDIAAAGLVFDASANAGFDFADPYLDGINQVLVSNKYAAPIRTLADLSGRQIYVRHVQSHYESLAVLNQQLLKEGLHPVRTVKADAYLTSEDILEMLNAGIIDLSVAESHLAELWLQVMPNLTVYKDFLERKEAALAWMVRRNNPKLKKSLNLFVKSHKKGTRLGNIFFNRYFKDAEWIKNPLAGNSRESFSAYASLFRKYGALYDIDWRLLSALAYQESGMNNSRRSAKGAVGIMQVLQSTALDPHINIPDYHLLENNIHAGAKYLAWLRDTYFTDEDMQPGARIRFALAAYNAGPAKIKEVRSLTAKMGFDPNRWFRHGEVGALRLIGRETVRFVSNVNKYYLAYLLFDTLDCLKGQHRDRVPRARR